MSEEIEVCPASELTPGVVVGGGPWAVGNADGDLFAVSRRCRHLYADLASGTIDKDGCLTCPWHGSKYDVKTGRMVLGPQGVFAKIPGFGAALKMMTKVFPCVAVELSDAMRLSTSSRRDLRPDPLRHIFPGTSVCSGCLGLSADRPRIPMNPGLKE